MASQDPVNNDVTSYMESEIVEIMPSQDPVTMEDGENGLVGCFLVSFKCRELTNATAHFPIIPGKT
jgi:hypothetical protein